jgi:hypothetical protein
MIGVTGIEKVGSILDLLTKGELSIVPSILAEKLVTGKRASDIQG